MQRFEGLVRKHHLVAYHECSGCGSLQTDPPAWLAAAYESGHLAQGDTGAVLRTLLSLGSVLGLVRAGILPRGARVLDFGGGSGLLCRLLRDTGFDAWVMDRHAKNVFAPQFTATEGAQYDLVTAFEVVEHFAEPRLDWCPLLASGSQHVLVSTELYEGQLQDWWYLAMEDGQHIFFYSARALDLLAQRHGYHYLPLGNLHLFSRRPLRGLRKILVTLALSDRGRRLCLAGEMPGIDYSQAVRDARRAR